MKQFSDHVASMTLICSSLPKLPKRVMSCCSRKVFVTKEPDGDADPSLKQQEAKLVSIVTLC